MISRLVLVRHAKTETRAAGKDDLSRSLTKAGVRSIEARFPFAACLMADLGPSELQMWSSPALRAMQTAAVLSECLGTEGMELHDSLYGIDFKDFLAELREASGTVIAVGHNPFMEELYGHLSGQFQHFEKGAMASFAFLPEEPAEDGSLEFAATLEWFVQGPDHTRWKTLAQMEKALAGAGERIEVRTRELLENPDDVEALHRYRISLRVARSLVRFVEPYQRGKANRKLARLLKWLQAPTSRVRELDMLVASLPQGRAVCGACVVEQQRERAAFLKKAKSHKAQKAREQVVRLLQGVQWRSSVEMCGLSREQLAVGVQAELAAFSDGVDRIDFADQEAVHDLRKHAKALRYVSREFADALPQGGQRLSGSMKAVQDKLGELCDARVNARLVREICGEGDEGLAASFLAQADMIVKNLQAQQGVGA